MGRVSVAGLRSDYYAAGVELFSALAIGVQAHLEVVVALDSLDYYLDAGDTFMAPRWWLIGAPVAEALIHAVPAMLLAIAAVFFRRSDPFLRPVLGALTAIALGSAHANSVMGFYGEPLLYCGAFAAFLALRPRGLAAAVIAAGAAVLLGYSSIRLNIALYPWLLGQNKGLDLPINWPRFLTAVSAGAAALGLTAWRLRLRGATPEVPQRGRVLLTVAFFLPASAATYWLLVKLGLPLSA